MNIKFKVILIRMSHARHIIESEFSQICKTHKRKVTPGLLTKLYLFIKADSSVNIKFLEKLSERFPIVYFTTSKC